MKIEWTIRSIKHQADGSWDALLISTCGGVQCFDRVVSDDGFRWITKYRDPVREDIQDMLTQAMGCMLDQGINFVVI